MKNLITFVLLMAMAVNGLTRNTYVYNTKLSDKVITVGAEGSMIQGFSNKAIQAAVCALSKTGGTVKLTEGVFEILGAVKLSSNVNLEGSGSGTILKITNGVRTHYIDDADYGELFVKVENPQGFKVGMDIQIKDDICATCWNVSTARITAIEGDTIYFDENLIEDYKADKNGIISNSTSGIKVIEGANVKISNLVIEGNREKSSRMDGCKGAGIYAYKAKNIRIENVEIRNYFGEGISWQITENVTVKNCNIHNNAYNGCHPGTGSPHTIIEDNDIYNNDKDGIFICWRVKNSIIRNNKIHDNTNGICTGHKDTDVLFIDNHIYDNRESGVKFREEIKRNAPHNNTFENNVIENNGRKGEGYGFMLLSPAENLVLKNNIIRDNDGKTQKAAIFYGKNSLPAVLKGNKMSGYIGDNIIKEQ